MRKILIVVFVFLSIVVKSQEVSPFVGYCSTGSIIFGTEFKSDRWGGFVEKYTCDKNFDNYSEIPYIEKKVCIMSTQYDGLMFGVNRHFKSMSNVLISFGIGLLDEITLYEGYSLKDMLVYNHDGTVIHTPRLKTSKKTFQKIAFEFSGGQDFEINDHLIMGLKAGFNTKTEIFGTISIGYRF
jgi:hypothetical protein